MQHSQTRQVAITGMGIVSPLGNSVAQFWDALQQGRSGIRPVQRIDVSQFTSKIGGEVDQEPSLEGIVDTKEARRLDRSSKFGVFAAGQAVLDAGMVGTDGAPAVDPARVGVLIGSGIGGLETIEKQYELFLQRGAGRVSPFLIPMIIINTTGAVIAMRYQFTGPNFAIATACASATHSIGEAFRIIQRGEADAMVAGGTDAALTNLGFSGFCSMRALSTRNDDPERASRPFERDRDGFVIAEGAGMLVLEELEQARKRGAHIYGRIIGYGSSADAYHITSPVPNGGGLVKALGVAMADAQLHGTQIDYYNAHGTSTDLNDKIETIALKRFFGEETAHKLSISSTKSMTGHLLGAAGGVEAVASLLAIRDGVVPPTINYQTPDPECDLDYTPNKAVRKPVRTAMSASMGFGGHNAVIIMQGGER